MATGHVGEFPVGSLVRVRERDWVVLPSDDTDILCLRPLSGSESEICGIHRAIEGANVDPTEFAPPQPDKAGDFIAGKLLRNAGVSIPQSQRAPVRGEQGSRVRSLAGSRKTEDRTRRAARI